MERSEKLRIILERDFMSFSSRHVRSDMSAWDYWAADLTNRGLEVAIGRSMPDSPLVWISWWPSISDTDFWVGFKPEHAERVLAMGWMPPFLDHP